jgi:radical SAM protein with 4Fe4S-binding SPASM domain
MFEKEIEEIPNFCVRPFVGLNVDPDGTIMQCCEQDKSWFNNLKINDFATLAELNACDNFEDVRQAMLQNRQHASCKKCWKLESVGVKSARQDFNDMYLTRPTLSSAEIPSYWDIRSSNICNLKCRMCHPAASDQIAKEQFINPPQMNFDQSLLMQNISHIQGLNLLGGEPTLDVKNTDMLNKLVQFGRTDVPILITTNATTARGKFFDLLSQFSSVCVQFSLDSVQATNDYIRTNSQYDKIIENILRYLEYNPTWTYSIGQCVSIYNLHDYWKLADEIKKLTGIETVYSSIVEYPQYLNINNLPMNIKQQYKNDNNTDSVNKILDQHTYDRQAFTIMFEFINYTNNLDLIRGTSFKDINPHMWNSIHEFMHENWKDYGLMVKGKLFT